MRVYESKSVHSKLLMWTLFAYADMFELTNCSHLFDISAQISEKTWCDLSNFENQNKQGDCLILFFYMEP